MAARTAIVQNVNDKLKLNKPAPQLVANNGKSSATTSNRTNR